LYSTQVRNLTKAKAQTNRSYFRREIQQLLVDKE